MRMVSDAYTREYNQRERRRKQDAVMRYAARHGYAIGIDGTEKIDLIYRNRTRHTLRNLDECYTFTTHTA